MTGTRGSVGIATSTGAGNEAVLPPKVLVALGVLLGATVAFAGDKGIAIAVVAGLLALGTAVPLQKLAMSIIAVLLLAPFDFVGAFSDSALGVPVVLLVLCALCAPLVLGEITLELRLAVPFAVLLGAVALSTVVTRDTGGLRFGALWLSGVALATAITTGSENRSDRLWRVVWLIAIASALASLVALGERFLGLQVSGLIPDYHPMAKTAASWSRPASILGHPLRLGALAMLGALSSLLLFLKRRQSLAVVACGLLSGLALLLSGARGSWLALAVGVAVLIALAGGRQRRKLLIGFAGVGLAGLIVAIPTGVASFVFNRLAGSAADPTSFEQRRLVLKVTGEMFAEKPFLGFGFSDYAVAIMERGVRVPSLESDYVGLLLKGGVVVTLAFVLLIGYVLTRAYAERRDPLVGSLLVLLAALLVNMATFNLFDWTAMPVLFSVILGGLFAAAEESSLLNAVARRTRSRSTARVPERAEPVEAYGDSRA